MECSLRETVARQIGVNTAFARLGLNYFLSSIVVNSSPHPMVFGKCADSWQRELAAPMIPAIDHLAGLNEDYTGPLRFMQILARGHNKSSLEAWIAAFLLIASKRIINGYILAADRDQGRLILQALEKLIQLNPWIGTLLSVTKNRISGPAGFIEVLPCDAASAMGLQGNFYIADEFVHWKRQKEWTALVSGLGKVTPTVFVALSNAGLKGSWQHEVFLEAEAHPDTWVVFHRLGTLASWWSPKTIAEDRLLFPPSEAKRLFDNHWIDPTEEYDYLSRLEVDACARLGVMLDLTYRLRMQYGVTNYVASIDYGPKKDRTVLCLQHLTRERVCVIDRMDVWRGCDYPTGKVPIEKVEAWITETRKAFQPRVYVVDPYQMEGTIQWCEKIGVPIEPFASRAGAGNFEMAQHLRALIVEQRLAWYDGCGDLLVADKRTGVMNRETLADELVGLRVKRMPYGYRFDHENQKHDDRAVAIAMGALRAVDYPWSSGTTPCLPKPVIEQPDRRR